MSPIHANEMDGAVDRPARRMAKGGSQKGLELGRGELA